MGANLHRVNEDRRSVRTTAAVTVLRTLFRTLRYLLRGRRLALLIEIAFLLAVLHLTYSLIDRVWSPSPDEAGYPRVPTSLERYRSP